MLAVGPPRSEITPVKPGHRVADLLDLAHHRVLRAALDDAALVLGDRAEGAAAEAAALDGDREADHLVRGDLRARRRTDAAGAGTAARRPSPSPPWCSGIGGGLSHTSTSPCRCTSARALPGLVSRCRMREACAYSTGSRATCSYDGMRITLRSRSALLHAAHEAHHLARAGRRGGAQAPRPARRGSIAYGSIGGVRAVRAHRGASNRSRSSPSGVPRRTNAVPRRSRDRRRWLRRAARRCAISTIARSALPYTSRSALRIEQDRAAHLLRPVVEVRDAAQRGLDAADDDRHVAERLAAALRIDDDASDPAACRPRRPACRRRRCACAGPPV